MRPYVGAEVAIFAIGATLIVGVYLVAVLDRLLGAVVAGAPIRPIALGLDPARTAAQLLLQQRRTTERPDAPGWAFAPALFLGLGALALAMVPLGPDLVVADPATGFVVFSAAIAFVMIAVFLHGWSPNSPFALHGAYRYGAAALSFQIPFLLAMLATALPAQSLSIVDIVRGQESLWNVVREPLGLPIYLIVGVAVSFWGSAQPVGRERPGRGHVGRGQRDRAPALGGRPRRRCSWRSPRWARRASSAGGGGHSFRAPSGSS